MNIVFSFYGIKHCLGWPLTVNHRSNKSPAHVFVAKAYGHCVDSMVTSSTTLTPTEQPTARNSASKHKAQLNQSLLASLKRDLGIGCLGYSQTHKSSAR